MTELLIPERQFSQAKSELSEVMDEVVHEHRPQVVLRKGRERMVLVRSDDLRRWLDTFRLRLRVVLDPGEVTVAADPLGVAGFGDSLEAALDDLLVEIRDYAHRFFERQQFYAETDAGYHAPWLARFALTDVDEQRALLEADMEAEMKAALTQGEHAVPSAV